MLAVPNELGIEFPFSSMSNKLLSEMGLIPEARTRKEKVASVKVPGDRPADRKELIALLKRSELFALLATDAPHLPNGTRYVTGPEDSIALKTAQLGDLYCVAFFTDRSIDPRLQQGCVSMNGEEA